MMTAELKNICCVDGCNKPVECKRYCKMHNRRIQRHGNPSIILIKKHNQSNSLTYSSWDSMIQRCTNPKSTNYERWGGRGIKVCEDWVKFENFYRDMGDRPSIKHQIDRINNNGNYEPGNCRWVTNKINTRNSSRTKMNAEKVNEIRSLIKQGYGIRAIGRMYNIGHSVISNIKNKKVWIDV